MPSRFVVSRVGNQRLMIRYQHHYVAECLGDDTKNLNLTLTLLGLKSIDEKMIGQLREAIELFNFRENRSIEKFGKPRKFRIWRIDKKTLQVDFDGGYAELGSKTGSAAALKQCLHDLSASDLLLNELQRDLADFHREERP